MKVKYSPKRTLLEEKEHQTVPSRYDVSYSKGRKAGRKALRRMIESRKEIYKLWKRRPKGARGT